MAIVVGLLAMFLFGIITFGIILSFKQSLTQASNEAARAAAVAPRSSAVDATPVTRARAAANRVASGWGAECGKDGLTCSFVIAPCSNGTGTTSCMTVVLRYDLAGHPRTPVIPIVSSALPKQLVTTVVVEVNEVETT